MQKQDYYTKQEVKRLLKDNNLKWEDFEDFMVGQTSPIVGSEFCYYTWDVDRFINKSK